MIHLQKQDVEALRALAGDIGRAILVIFTASLFFLLLWGLAVGLEG